MYNSITFLENENNSLTHYTPYYFVGPLIGATLAGGFHILHKMVLLEEKEDENHNFNQEYQKGLIDKD